MSADENGHQIGFWRYPSHRRKCLLAGEFTVEKAIARARKQRLLDNALATSVGVVFAAFLVVATWLGVAFVCGDRKPHREPRVEVMSVDSIEYVPAQPIRYGSSGR